MSDERVSWDGGLPSFLAPVVDLKTGQWTEQWRPIIEMLFRRTGGDFDDAFRAAADADATRSQFAEISRTLDILGGQVASLRDALTAGNNDEARISRLEAAVQQQAGRIGGVEASTSGLDEARLARVENAINAIIGQINNLSAISQAENVFAQGENQDVSFKKVTVNNTLNAKGNATIAGSGFQLGFFSFGGVTRQTVTFTNTNGAIGGLTISNPPTQAEVQALRNACETLADDTRNLRAALAAYNLIA